MTEETLDPDKFNLSKAQVILIINAIGKRWTKSTTARLKNSKYIISLEAMKIAINLTPEEVIQEIWKDMLMGINELMRLNDMERMKQEFPNTQAMIDIVIKKLEDGTLFDKRK
jgi:hypothetical protein